MIIQKNMEGHRKRNEKTTVMYSIALAFLIFSGTGFKLQTVTIGDVLSSSIAADLKVVAAQGDPPLNEAGLKEFMISYNEKFPGNIGGYTFVTPPLNRLPTIP